MLRNIYDRTFYLLLQSSCFKERLQSGFRPSEIRLKRCVNTKLSEWLPLLEMSISREYLIIPDNVYIKVILFFCKWRQAGSAYHTKSDKVR